MAKKRTRPQSVAEEIGKKRPFDDPEVEAYVNLVRTHEHLEGMCARFFKAHGITSPQYNVLRILRGHGKRMRTYQVAADMVSREPDITRLLDRLVERGLVSRERCPEDRRVVWVELTAEGAALLKSLDRPVKELHRSQLGHLTDQKLRQLSKLLFEARHAAS
jgi:DNA-binding MarR family transcriptional regulator